jgi:hypothetical protein
MMIFAARKTSPAWRGNRPLFCAEANSLSLSGPHSANPCFPFDAWNDRGRANHLQLRRYATATEAE